MTIMTAMMMTISLTMTVITLPRIYSALLEAKLLNSEEERELLRELLEERNDWVLRHLGCALIVLILIWLVKNSPDMEVPNPLAAAMAIYVAISMISAVLESLLAKKIAGYLAVVPAAVKVRDQR